MGEVEQVAIGNEGDHDGYDGAARGRTADVADHEGGTGGVARRGARTGRGGGGRKYVPLLVRRREAAPDVRSGKKWAPHRELEVEMEIGE